MAAAEKLGRQWLGIDITHLAVALMKNRLKTMFNLEPGQDYAVVGEPQDAGSARALWEQDPYQFQFWAVSLLEAQPQSEQRRGADRGIDGVIYFVDGPRRTPQKVVVQVKGGRVSSPQVRDLKGVVEREKAAMGLFITLEEPTRDMRSRGGQRRLLPLGPVAAGLPPDTATHHRGVAGGPGLRAAPAPARLPTRGAGPPGRGDAGPAGGGLGRIPDCSYRRWLKFTTVAYPFVRAAASYNPTSTVTSGVSRVATSKSAASVSPSRSKALLADAAALAITTS